MPTREEAIAAAELVVDYLKTTCEPEAVASIPEGVAEPNAEASLSPTDPVAVYEAVAPAVNPDAPAFDELPKDQQEVIKEIVASGGDASVMGQAVEAHLAEVTASEAPAETEVASEADVVAETSEAQPPVEETQVVTVAEDVVVADSNEEPQNADVVAEPEPTDEEIAALEATAVKEDAEADAAEEVAVKERAEADTAQEAVNTTKAKQK